MLRMLLLSSEQEVAALVFLGGAEGSEGAGAVWTAGTPRRAGKAARSSIARVVVKAEGR